MADLQPPPAPAEALHRTYGMPWYPLHGVGVLPNFYHHLWRSGWGGEPGNDPNGAGPRPFSAFLLPDTVLFRGNKVDQHFFFANGGKVGAAAAAEDGGAGTGGGAGGTRVGVSRKHSRNVTNAHVFEAMAHPYGGNGSRAEAQQASAGVCAVLLYERVARDGSGGGSGTVTPATASVEGDSVAGNNCTNLRTATDAPAPVLCGEGAQLALHPRSTRC
jgi:hypothetical protein